MLELSFAPFTLKLLHPFTISGFTRNTTPIVLVEIKYEDYIGYGEASLPPYLSESQESVMRFLAQVKLSRFNSPLEINEILDYVDSIESGNNAAKASVDIALHDLLGKLMQKPWHKIIEADKSNMPETSLTIGIDAIDKIKLKVLEANDFHILKIKLGAAEDKKIIEAIREITDAPLYVDVNQGWLEKEFALDMIHWLKEKNVQFVEQPLPKENFDDATWLYERSPLPIIADEAVQRFKDIEKIMGAYHGINIKLMKCTGMREAFFMMGEARKLNLKVLIGCMNESSCANMAAAQLAPLADWVDLDGPFMISNNPFERPILQKGRIILQDIPGLGVVKNI